MCPNNTSRSRFTQLTQDIHIYPLSLSVNLMQANSQVALDSILILNVKHSLYTQTHGINGKETHVWNTSLLVLSDLRQFSVKSSFSLGHLDGFSQISTQNIQIKETIFLKVQTISLMELGSFFSFYMPNHPKGVTSHYIE